MKIHIFGSCSGTEPFPDRHQTAWALDHMDRLYWFDAGEGCGYTAHTAGVDLLSVSDIFISHSHLDHTGGLPHLLWTIRKLNSRLKKLPKYGDITVYSPQEDVYRGALLLLGNRYQSTYRTNFVKETDGILLKNDHVTVTAQHNLHMKPTEEGYRSFSYLIEADGKKLVYSGDVASPEELDPWVSAGCDALLMETCHHSPTEICERWKDQRIGHLFFLHHGRAILSNFDALLKECRKILPNVTFCNDGDVFEL